MHRNAPLTPEGRLLLCERIEGGWPVAHASEAMNISRDRGYVWCLWGAQTRNAGLTRQQERLSR